MKTLSRIYNTLIFAFLYAPILVLIVFSFNDSKSRVVWNGFSLRWYEALFQNDEILSALWITFSIAIIATIVIIATFVSPDPKFSAENDFKKEFKLKKIRKGGV